MLQRGLAILLSVCMLAGGTSDTVYAMSPQSDVGVVSAEQNVSDTGKIPDFSTEDAAGDPAAEDGETSEKESAESGDGAEGDVVGSEATDGDSTEDGDGATGDVADNEDNTLEDSADREGDTEQSGTEDDENTSESEDGSDGDASASEDEDIVVESEVGVSVQSIKDEELTLAIDDPQTVTLAEDEKQWLSFTAPQDGIYRFYSTSEEVYQDRYVYLFHEKSDNEYAYFDHDYANGQNGNFNCAYRMQANETVYLLVMCRGISSLENGTFTVNAEKVEAEELAVTKTDGGYTLQSDSYRLNLVFTPSYRTVGIVMELQQADGSALSDGSYRIHYAYSYDDVWGEKSSSNHTINYSDEYQNWTGFSDIAAGGEFVITELQIWDDSDNVLAALHAGERAISVNTLITDKQGVLTQVSAEDTSIEVRAEMTSGNDGCLRYRKKEETEWSYKNISNNTFDDAVTLPALPDTDYVIELLAEDEGTVYDTAEIRTKVFAASDINVEVTDITITKATVKVTIGAYTGNDRYIQARVSYIDGMGDARTSTGYVDADSIASDSIDLSLSNLAAGTEYKDLEVELNHTDYPDSYSMEYVAYKEKVSFTTAVSTLATEQFDVTVTFSEMDYSSVVVHIALPDVTEEDPYYGYGYDYTAKYRVVGSKYWWKSTKGVLTAGYDDSDHDEWELFSLVGDTEYEVLVMMDGVVKKTTFTTKAAAVAATVEVKPLAQGVQVTATLTGALSKDDVYYFSVRYYDQNTRSWDNAYQMDDNCLTMENNWESTAVFSGAFNSDIRPNVEYDWKIVITDYNESMRVYDKILSLKTKSETGISLTAENITYTTADIKAVLAGRDASIQEGSANLYYREKGRNKWIRCDDIDIPSNEYEYEDDYTVYLDGLKEDTEYEVKLVLYGHPEDILAQTTFRTLKDTRSLSVSIDNCRYTSAQVKWSFDSGANVSDNDSYICIYYREKGDKKWIFWDDEWVWMTRTGKADLTDLKEGTSYEVLVELKDGYSTVAGESVVRDAKTEFTTAVIDHELKAEPVESETDATFVTFDMQLSRKAGALENREKAVVTLQSADADSIQSKIVNFNKDNQYKAKVKVSGLLPNTKYTVYAELYESENNEWIWLKDFTLVEVTTKEAKAPTSLTISETKFVLNKGTSKKLTVTAQPQEAAVGLTWTSSDAMVATVGKDGTVTAHKAGEAEITVSSASAADGGSEKVSAVSHVTVRDYEIRVKNADGSYDDIPSPLSKSQKRTLVVCDNADEQDLSGVSWSSSNPNAARISADGLLEPQNYGQANITAKTEEGIILKHSIEVVNEIQGFSITRPETDNDSYQAIRTAEAVYQVAAGETYRVGCVLSPAYTDRYDTTVSMPGNRFTWSADNDAVTVKVSEYDKDWTEITIPASVSGPIKVSAVMKDEEYKDKSFTITLDVLKKPEVEWLPDTYTWLDYSNKLRDVGLPENWQWKEQDTLIYEPGQKTFTACYAQPGYYPYEIEVDVYAENIGNSLSVTGANYSTEKKAYIVKKAAPLKVRMDALGESIPTLLYEQSVLAPVAKDAAKVSVSCRMKRDIAVLPLPRKGPIQYRQQFH